MTGKREKAGGRIKLSITPSSSIRPRRILLPFWRKLDDEIDVRSSGGLSLLLIGSHNRTRTRDRIPEGVLTIQRSGIEARTSTI